MKSWPPPGWRPLSGEPAAPNPWRMLGETTTTRPAKSKWWRRLPSDQHLGDSYWLYFESDDAPASALSVILHIRKVRGDYRPEASVNHVRYTGPDQDTYQVCSWSTVPVTVKDYPSEEEARQATLDVANRMAAGQYRPSAWDGIGPFPAGGTLLWPCMAREKCQALTETPGRHEKWHEVGR